MYLRILAAAVILVSATPAAAQVCTFTNTGINWGNVNLASGSNIDLTGNLRITCTGIAGRTVRICPNFNAGSGGANANGTQRYMLNGAQQLAYNLYSDAARATVWGSNTWGKPPGSPTINLKIKGSGTATANATIYGRIFSGQGALPTGSYSSSFSGTQTQVAYAYSTVGNCNAIGLTNLTNVPFTVQAAYGGSCIVNSASAMNFGTAGVLSSNIDATNSITVTCASGTGYTIGLDGGLSGATDPTQRQLSDAAITESVTYGVYRDSGRSQPWGNTIGTNTVTATGTGAAQSFTAYGRVPPQATPSAQTYTDTVVVTVTY